MKKFVFQNVIWREGKYYVAQCLNVDVSSFGKTKQEALSNLEEAMDLYFEDTPFDTISEIKSPILTSRELVHGY